MQFLVFRHILVNIDYYLKNTMLDYDNFNLSEPEELEFREKIEQEFIKNIYGNIKEATRAFSEGNLNGLENE
ncbi:MAG: hypothetical protein LBQ71_07530 [Hungatella sp.]|jgi:hypothetical protein|nr:hypothetical protein [Hungatella sp.]